MGTMFSVFGDAVLLCLFLGTLIAKTSAENVGLEIRDRPISFGKDADLLCNLSAIPGCCSNTVTWMRNHDIIIHHGVSVNVSKYVQVQTQSGFVLQIKHFDSADVNVKYLCLYQFFTFRKFLRMNEDDFEMFPPAGSIFINTTFGATSNKIVTELLFKKVFPKPKCILLADDLELKTKTELSWSMSGVFYRIYIVLTANYTTDMCGRYINITCISWKKQKVTQLDSYKTINCTGIPTTVFPNLSTHSSIVIISISLAVVSTLLVLTARFYQLKRHTKRQQTTENGDETIPLIVDTENKPKGVRQDNENKGLLNLKKVVKIVKMMPCTKKDKYLEASQTMIFEEMVNCHDNGKYDENRGNGLFPPTNHCSKDPSNNIPMQKIKDFLQYLIYVIKDVAKSIYMSSSSHDAVLQESDYVTESFA